MSILAGFGFTAEEILEALTEKNIIWERLIFVKEIQKKVIETYSKNPLYVGSGIGKANDEFSIVCYWAENFEDMNLMPPQWSGVPVEHIVTGIIQLQ
jgi:hypothetical protein